MRELLLLLRNVPKAWWHGLRSTGVLVAHPLRSAQLVWAAWRLSDPAKAVLVRMYTTGIAVPPPEAAQGLCTMLSGFGDVTTRVTEPARLTPKLVEQHIERVQAALQPLRELAEALARLNAAVVALPSLGWFLWNAFSAGPDELERVAVALVQALALSLLCSVLAQLAVFFTMRHIRALLRGS